MTKKTSISVDPRLMPKESISYWDKSIKMLQLKKTLPSNSIRYHPTEQISIIHKKNYMTQINRNLVGYTHRF